MSRAVGMVGPTILASDSPSRQHRTPEDLPKQRRSVLAGAGADPGDRLTDLVVRRGGASGDPDPGDTFEPPRGLLLRLEAGRLVPHRSGGGIDAVGVLDVVGRHP